MEFGRHVCHDLTHKKVKTQESWHLTWPLPVVLRIVWKILCQVHLSTWDLVDAAMMMRPTKKVSRSQDQKVCERCPFCFKFAFWNVFFYSREFLLKFSPKAFLFIYFWQREIWSTRLPNSKKMHYFYCKMSIICLVCPLSGHLILK